MDVFLIFLLFVAEYREQYPEITETQYATNLVKRFMLIWSGQFLYR